MSRERTTVEQPRVTYQGLPIFCEDGSVCRDVLTPTMRMMMDLLGQMRGNGSNEGRERVQYLPCFVRIRRSTSQHPQTFSSTVTTDLRSMLSGVLAYSVSLVMSK